MTRQTFRKRFVFWLDLEKDDEYGIAETIDDLKARRSFAKTIRDGIRLIVDLRGGRTTVLFQLFPWLHEKINTGAPGQGDSGQQVASGDLDQALEKHMQRLEGLILKQGAVPVHRPGDMGPPTPKPAASGEDLSGLVTVTESKTGSNASQNFLNSMATLGG